MRLLLFFGAFILFQQAIAVPEKWNACYITLNSENEKKFMTRFLGEEEFNHIELTDFSSKKDAYPKTDWFRRACQSSIKCHILTVSGHFTTRGRTFYGSSDKTLSLNTLQRQSCAGSCDGVLGSSGENYLFGCNTLNDHSGKKKLSEAEKKQKAKEIVRRSRKINKRLGIKSLSTEEALFIVETQDLVSADAVKSEMQQVFEGTYFLHGFDDIGPSGENAVPKLRKMFKRIRKYFGSYSNYLGVLYSTNMQAAKISLDAFGSEDKKSKDGLDELLSAIFVDRVNPIGYESFDYTHYKQCFSGNSFFESSSEYKKGIKKNLCLLLSDDPNDYKEQLELVKGLIRVNNTSSYLPAMINFIRTSPQAASEIQRYLEQDYLKEEAQKFKSSLINSLYTFEIGEQFYSAIELAESLNFIDNQQKKDIISSQLDLTLAQVSITEEDKNVICRYAKDGFWDGVKIKYPESGPYPILYKTDLGIEISMCLGIPVLTDLIFEEVKTSKNKRFIKKVIGLALSDLIPDEKKFINYKKLVEKFSNDPEIALHLFLQLSEQDRYFEGIFELSSAILNSTGLKEIIAQPTTYSFWSQEHIALIVGSELDEANKLNFYKSFLTLQPDLRTLWVRTGNVNHIIKNFCTDYEHCDEGMSKRSAVSQCPKKELCAKALNNARIEKFLEHFFKHIELSDSPLFLASSNHFHNIVDELNLDGNFLVNSYLRDKTDVSLSVARFLAKMISHERDNSKEAVELLYKKCKFGSCSKLSLLNEMAKVIYLKAKVRSLSLTLESFGHLLKKSQELPVNERKEFDEYVTSLISNSEE